MCVFCLLNFCAEAGAHAQDKNNHVTAVTPAAGRNEQ
jgi:hypothetical protein